MPMHDFFNIYRTYMYMYHDINNIFHVLIFMYIKNGYNFCRCILSFFSNLKVEVTQRTVTISEYLMALCGIVYCSM